MITTYQEARKLVLATYGEDFKFMVRADRPTIGVRPVYEQRAGFLTLCWQRVSPGRDSAVRVGLVEGANMLWQWDPATMPAPPFVPDSEIVRAQAERIRNLVSLNIRFRHVLQTLHTAPMRAPKCGCGAHEKKSLLHAADCLVRKYYDAVSEAQALLAETA